MSIRSLGKHHPIIAASAYVDAAAEIIGDVRLGEHSSVWPAAVLRGDVQRIEVGARSNIQDGCVLHVSHNSEYQPGGLALQVGDEVTVGHRVVLHACRIGDRCLIGMGSLVMDGAVIEAETLLGAGSLVTPGMRLQGGYLWFGSPARRVRVLSPREREYLRYSAANYVRLKDQYCGKA